MKTKKPLLQFGQLLFVLGALAGCSGNDVTIPSASTPPAAEETAPPKDRLTAAEEVLRPGTSVVFNRDAILKKKEHTYQGLRGRRYYSLQELDFTPSENWRCDLSTNAKSESPDSLTLAAATEYRVLRTKEKISVKNGISSEFVLTLEVAPGAASLTLDCRRFSRDAVQELSWQRLQAATQGLFTANSGSVPARDDRRFSDHEVPPILQNKWAIDKATTFIKKDEHYIVQKTVGDSVQKLEFSGRPEFISTDDGGATYGFKFAWPINAVDFSLSRNRYLRNGLVEEVTQFQAENYRLKPTNGHMHLTPIETFWTLQWQNTSPVKNQGLDSESIDGKDGWIRPR